MNVLREKKVAIIGLCQGLGFEIAKTVYQKGAEVILASRSLEKLKEAKSSIGEKVHIYQLDGSNEKQVCNFFIQFENIDHLVIISDLAVQGNLASLNSKVAKDLFESNLSIHKYAVKYGVPKMSKQGSITLFSGNMNQKYINGQMPYAELTRAIESLCKKLALELAPIRVNVISTDFNQSSRGNHFEPEDLQDASFKNLPNVLSYKRAGKVEYVVNAVLVLMGNDHVTGTITEVDESEKSI